MRLLRVAHGNHLTLFHGELGVAPSHPIGSEARKPDQEMNRIANRKEPPAAGTVSSFKTRTPAQSASVSRNARYPVRQAAAIALPGAIKAASMAQANPCVKISPR